MPSRLERANVHPTKQQPTVCGRGNPGSDRLKWEVVAAAFGSDGDLAHAPSGAGRLIFTDTTASLRGRPPFVAIAIAVAKAGPWSAPFIFYVGIAWRSA